MKQVSQTITVGDGSGLPGNCLQAAVASLLDLELDEVPHFALYDDWLERLVEFGDLRGYKVRHCPQRPAFGLAFGPSSRGVKHAVAYSADETWDPHPSRGGLLSVSMYIEFGPSTP